MGLLVPYLSIRSSLSPAFDTTGQSAEQRLYFLLEGAALHRAEARGGRSDRHAPLHDAAQPPLWEGRLDGALGAALLVVLLVQLMWVDIRLTLEKTLRPYVVSEFHQLQRFELQGSGVLWPRQKWYLPYIIAMYVLCTGAILATIFVKGAESAIAGLLPGVEQLPAAQVHTKLRMLAPLMWNEVQTPLVLIGLDLLVTAGVSTWRLASYQSEGALSVQRAIAALASGTPRLPDWVGTDEVGDLSMATARVFVHLKRFSLSLGESARALVGSAHELRRLHQRAERGARPSGHGPPGDAGDGAGDQADLDAGRPEGRERPAADRRAERSAARARWPSSEPRRAAGHPRAGEGMARQIRELEERTRQIALITTTVKDLADQSNMLALNAAIEAVRSGEHGKGFGVVAREIRTLADQSIRATNSVRSILEDIGTAIRDTVIISEKGAERVERGSTRCASSRATCASCRPSCARTRPPCGRSPPR